MLFTTAILMRATTESTCANFSDVQILMVGYYERRILTYLIPLRILRGHLPSRELLDKFPVLDELYTPFIEAIRRGAIKSFDTALDKWERRLVDLNLWLTLEKGRELCIRGLFRRVFVFFPQSCGIVSFLLGPSSRDLAGG